MTARRVLLALAAVIAAASVGFAVKPFHATGGIIPKSSYSTGAFLLSSESCRAPVLDAWHGKRERWAVSVGSDTIGNPMPTRYVDIVTCRSEARHRLRLSALGLLGALALVWFARRPRFARLPPSPA